MRDNPPVSDLVMGAKNSEKRAWDALVKRYDPLIWSICRGFKLSRADAEDVRQAVWLYLVRNLHNLHEPNALPGWLATTTRRECQRIQRTGRPLATRPALDAETLPDDQAGADQGLLAAERKEALREAFLDLPSGGQRLIVLLLQDPPLPYTEISVRLGIPVGSIGPYRRRYLDRMRRHPAIAALISAEAATATA